MKTNTLQILKKIGRMRPKPSTEDLEDLFGMIKQTDLDALLELCSVGKSKANVSLAQRLISDLRRVGGRAKDFKPYLLDEISLRKLDIQGISKKTSLTQDCQAFEDQFPREAKGVVKAAFQKYVSENDQSYHLKSA